MNLSDNQKQWIAYLLVAIVLTAVSATLGVRYPIPDPPDVAPFDQPVVLPLGAYQYQDTITATVPYTATCYIVFTTAP